MYVCMYIYMCVCQGLSQFFKRGCPNGHLWEVGCPSLSICQYTHCVYSPIHM